MLRAAIAAQIDWSTLALVPGSFVDPALKELRTDLLFSATLAGQRVLVYVLLEHQSRADPFMPLRLLAYMVRIWEHERRERPEAKLLPAILPVVVSHDDARWSAPTSFAELLDAPPELNGLIRSHMVDFEMVLDDLTEARDDELRGRAMTALGRVALFCLQRARGSPDFVAELERWSDILREVVDAPSGVAALGAILRYISHTTQVHPERLRELAVALGPKGEVAMSTAAEIWTKEGEAKGRAEGKAEGVLSVLEARGLAVGQEQRARILGCSDLAVLEQWLRRAVTAAATDDVFAE